MHPPTRQVRVVTPENIASTMNLAVLLRCIGLVAVGAATAMAVGWLDRHLEKWAETHPPRDRGPR